MRRSNESQIGDEAELSWDAVELESLAPNL
jgi:hypothetical protein